MKSGDTTKSVMLNFKHPVKELFFVSQSDVSFQNNYPNEYNTITNAELRFNNEVVFNRDAKFLAYEQSLKHHVNSPILVQLHLVPHLGMLVSLDQLSLVCTHSHSNPRSIIQLDRLT